MAVQTPPYALQNSSHGAELFRRAVASFLGAGFPTTLVGTGWSTTAAGSTTKPGGVINVADFAVTQNGGGNMSVNVGGGQIWMPGTNASNQGLYYGLNDATVNLVISAASVTNPRIDFVVATVNDAAYSGASNNWVLQVVTGTATSGATLSNLTGVGALPANSIPLAYVLVPANAASIITADILQVQPWLSPGNTGLGVRGLPAGRMFQNTLSALPNGAFTTVTNFVADYMRGGMVITGGNTLVVPVAGVYTVKAVLAVSTTSTTSTALAIYKNGVEVRQIIVVGQSALTDDILCAASDSLQLVGFNNTGGSINTAAGTQFTSLSASLTSV